MVTPRALGAGSAWMLIASVATLSATAWLRNPTVGYVAVVAGATALAMALLVKMTVAGRRWPLLWSAVSATFVVTALVFQAELSRVEHDWAAASRERADRAQALFASEIGHASHELIEQARQALRLPPDPEAAMVALGQRVDPDAGFGVLLMQGGHPMAWGGQIHTSLDPASVPIASVRHDDDVQLVATRSPFYLTLDAVAVRGERIAVASMVLEATPPADRIATPLANVIAEHAGITGFDLVPVGDTLAGGLAVPSDAPVLRLRAREQIPEQMALAVRIRSVEAGALLAGLMLIAFIVAVWRETRSRPRRLLALAIALVGIAIVPLSILSPRGAVFDPAYYYAALGGPFTATSASFGLTAAVMLLALLTVLRTHRRRTHRGLAALGVLVVAGLGPFLMRDLARGVNPPAAGITIPLWLGWEIPLFLAGVSILLAGATAGRAALRHARGLPPVVAPILAVGAALLGPILWQAPGRWPWWYPLPWVAAMAALALTRRTRGLVLTAAVVAACGATILVWGAVSRRWSAYAEQDIAALNRSDPTMAELAQRFADRLSGVETPTTEAALLREYVAAELAAAGYTVSLAAWQPDGTLGAELLRSPVDPWPPELAEAVTVARSTATPVVREGRGAAVRVLVVAVPYPDGWVAGGVIAPKTRTAGEDPSLVLLGLAEPRPRTSPYAIALTPARDVALLPGAWRRRDAEIHGDWPVRGGAEPHVAHVEIEIRPLDVLIQRGTLAVLLDLAIVAILWALSAIADGGFARWLRGRSRRWLRSYRAQLTLALFAFFVVPAVAFALWSWRRLRAEDLQTRSRLAAETLRLATSLPELSRQRASPADAPILVYEDGILRDATNSAYVSLAPTGRLLPPDVHLNLDLGDEVSATRRERLGETEVLFGYRVGRTPSRTRAVFATPAPTNEAAVEQRRRDLGILVLFATAVGALAALWLSGFAARRLAEPIGRLRRAALAIASGGHEPLVGDATVEFQPVFSAFRRMSSDLAQSREALEESQRRTAAILRNVASGVIAVRPDLSVSLANPRADALLGHALPPGTRLEDVASKDLLESLRYFIEANEDEWSIDMTIGDRQVRVRFTRLARADGGAVVTIEDVTELSRAQRVLAWGEMARQVAHEIKNPLTPIRLGVQHLQRARGDRRVNFDEIFERNMDRILREIDRLDEIARTFSRYGAPAADRAGAEPVDVAAVVRDALGLEQMGEGGVEWTATGAERPVMVLAQRDELREVLLNLLENARLANAKHVRVSIAPDTRDVALSVHDDGDGIEPEALPRIFDPQFSTRTSGSGLGLAVSRRLVEGWGGSIDAKSTPRRGTTITVRLVTP